MYKGENKTIFWSKFYMITRKTLVYSVLIALSILCLFTLYILIANSTRSHATLINPVKGAQPLFGRSFAKNFGGVWTSNFQLKYGGGTSLIRAMANSLIIAVGATVCCVYFSTVTAYAIHMYRFKLRNAAFTFILVIMMIPTQVSTTGLIRMIYDLRWNNHFFPLILPSIAAPVTFFYIKQYMESVLPFEMVEAARVDGAGELRIFHQIVLPVMKPALAVQVIFAFVASWNNYFIPQLILQSPDRRTLPIVIAGLYSASDGAKDYGLIYMAIFISIIPLTIVYFAFSRFIMKGLTLGAVKG